MIQIERRLSIATQLTPFICCIEKRGCSGIMIKNYWDPFEYDKLKLLCHKEKVQSIMDVQSGIKILDNMPPISVEMHLTDNCNLNCPWCTDRDLHGNGAVLSLNKIKEMFRYFGQVGSGVTLEGGGEPTIHPDFREIVRYGSECNVDMGLITNGTVDISDSINCFKWVRISLDSSNRDEYIVEKGRDMFNRVMGNILQYREIRNQEKSFLGIGYVLTTRNYHDIEDIVCTLDDYGVDYIYFRPVEEAPEITPSRDELYDLRKQLLKLTENRRIKFMLTINDRLEYDNAGLPCIAHSLTSIIHANGDVVCCEKRRHDEITFGNVNEMSYKEIWMSGERIKTTEKLRTAECQKGCSVCRITPFNRILDNLKNINSKSFI